MSKAHYVARSVHSDRSTKQNQKVDQTPKSLMETSSLISTRSTDSTIGIGTANKSNTSLEYALGPGQSMSPHRKLNNTILLICPCPAHPNKILLINYGAGLYLPFFTLKQGQPTVSNLTQRIHHYRKHYSLKGQSSMKCNLIELVYIQLPPNQDFITRHTFHIELTRSKILCLCSCPPPPNHTWYSLEEIKTRLLPSLFGPEPYLIPDHHDDKWILQEHLLEDVTKYLPLENHYFGALLKKLEVKDWVLYRLYYEYLCTSFPSTYITQHTLAKYLNRSVMFHVIYEPVRMFNAWKIDLERRDKYLDWDEFLFGHILMDPDTPNVSPYIDIRISYLFRYYAHSGHIQLEDLLLMAKDLETSFYRNPMGLDQAELRAHHESELNAVLNTLALEPPLNYTQFHDLFHRGASKYIDIDHLWRLNRPLSYHFAAGDIENQLNPVEVVKRRLAVVCPACKEKPPIRITEHSVKVEANGRIAQIYANQKWVGTDGRASKITRTISKFTFNEKCFPNYLRRILHEETGSNKAAKQARSRGSKLAHSLRSNYSKLIELCQSVDKLFRQFSLPEVLPPVIVLHPNMGSLPCSLPPVSPLPPTLSSIKLVYVPGSRAPSIEHLLWLVSNKALFADKFHLLRPTNLSQSQIHEQVSRMLPSGAQCDSLANTLYTLLEALPTATLIHRSILVQNGEHCKPAKLPDVNVHLEQTIYPRERVFIVKNQRGEHILGNSRTTAQNLALLVDQAKIRVFYF